MKYLVMECHRSYAIVLDHEGRFLRVANLNYEVGQQLDYVVEAGEKEAGNPVWKKKIPALLAMAACFCLLVLGSWQMVFATYGTVRMQINPDVQITVNRLDYVTGLKGLNEDGKALAEGYSVFGKKIKEVSNELADRAVEMGFLKEGGQIKLIVDSGNEKWKTAIEDMLILELDIHFDKSIVIQGSESQSNPASPSDKITIPVRPDSDDDDDDVSDSDDGDDDDDVPDSDDGDDDDDVPDSDDGDDDDDVPDSDDGDDDDDVSGLNDRDDDDDVPDSDDGDDDDDISDSDDEDDDDDASDSDDGDDDN